MAEEQKGEVREKDQKLPGGCAVGPLSKPISKSGLGDNSGEEDAVWTGVPGD